MNLPANFGTEKSVKKYVDHLVKYLLKHFEDLIDPNDIPRLYFTAKAAIWWFATDYHEGQRSPLYAMACVIPYHPGRDVRGIQDEDYEMRMFYHALQEKFGIKD